MRRGTISWATDDRDTRILADAVDSVIMREVTSPRHRVSRRAFAGYSLATAAGLALPRWHDAARSAAALSAEDDPEPSRAGVSLSVFEQLARGYLQESLSFLCPLEMQYLVFAARLITLEQAIRFLGDHLEGDRYYKVSRPGHNLDRARNQLHLLFDMEAKANQMEEIIKLCQ